MTASAATRGARKHRTNAIDWRPIADLPKEPEGHDYIIWLKGWGARDARWLPESRGWLSGSRVFSRAHATHYAQVNEPAGV